MKVVVLIIVTLAAFGFGYFVMKKVDDFIIENRRLVTAGNRINCCAIRIAAESPILLDSTALALEHCSNMYPYMEFYLSSCNVKRLMQRLSNGTIDIALLTEENSKELGIAFECVRIPHQAEQRVVTMLGLTVDNMDEEQWIYVVWNKAILSKDRDRVILSIENEHCRLKCGYCDYLD